MDSVTHLFWRQFSEAQPAFAGRQLVPIKSAGLRPDCSERNILACPVMPIAQRARLNDLSGRASALTSYSMIPEGVDASPLGLSMTGLQSQRHGRVCMLLMEAV